MKFLKILIICALIIFPFGELLRFGIGNNIVIKPLDIIAILILSTLSILVISKRIKLAKNMWIYFLFPLVCLLSLLINTTWLQQQQLLTSSLYFVRWVSYAAIFFAVANLEQSFKKKIIVILLIDGLLIVILGYLQYFFFNSLRPLYYLGWDDHLYRLFSVFLDPNFTGGILVLYLLFVMGLLYVQFTERTSITTKVKLFNFFKVKKRNYIIILSLICIATVIALFLTFSRSSFLMLLIGVSVFFVLIGRKKLILALLACFVLFIVLISPKLDVESINLFRVTSTNARIANVELAVDIFQKHQFFGVGFNTYRYAKDFYNIRSDWTNAPSHADAGVDNSFLFTLVTTGIVGLIMYLMLWFILLKQAFARFRKDKNIFAIIFIASSVGLFVHAMFINSLYFPAIMFWMWMIAGLMENK